MIKFYALLAWLLVWNIGADAQTFWKKYALSNSHQGIDDLIVVNANEYAFIVPNKLILTDGMGNIKKKWEPAVPEMGFTNLIRTTSGKFIVASTKQEATPGLYLFIVDAQMQQVKMVNIVIDDGLLSQKLLAGDNGNFYLVYEKRQPGKPDRLVVLQMNEDGQENWKREMPEGIMYKYAIQPGENGGIELAFSGLQDQILQVWKYTAAGDVSKLPIMPLVTDDEWNLPEYFAKTADGGYFFAGTELPASWYSSNTELLVMRTDARGQVLWKKLIDLNMNDELMGMEVDATGVYLLSISGVNMNFFDKDGKPDMAVSRLDLQGELKWVRAFGNSKNDFWGTHFALAPDGVLIGGVASWPGSAFSSPVLLKAGLDGSFEDPAFSFPLQSPSSLTTVQLPLLTKTQELVHILPLQGGAYLATGKLVGITEDDYSACVFKVNEAKQIEWYQFFTERVSKPGRLQPTSDGNYACLLWEYEDALSYTYLVKLSPTGKIIWKKNIPGKAVWDMTTTDDGGFMLSGNSVPQVSVTKMDADGNEVWTKSHSYPNFSMTGDLIQPTSDQHFIIAGILKNGANEDVGICMLKTDANGNANWIRAFKKIDTLIQAKCLMVTSGHVLIGGFSESYISGNRDAYLLKCDLSGSLIWSGVYEISGMDVISAMLPESDTAYYIAGATGELAFGQKRQYGFLANVNSDGTMNGKKFYGEGGPVFSITDVFANSDGKIRFAGHKQWQYGAAQPFFGETDMIVLSVGEEQQPASITLFPNPGKGTIWLKIRNNYSGELRISITGIDGKLMNSITSRKYGDGFSIPLNTGGLPGGIYAVEVLMGKLRVVRKIVVLP
ncbi:MAG: T9SS type A sorting domain-containing protein [Chitinophagaceae bacterium]|nr:T9SS type A sorting domain-containing protein [Chitinophagaceae bacterium]